MKEFLECHKSICTINSATIAATLGVSKYDRVSNANEKVQAIKKEHNSKFKAYKTKGRSDYYRDIP
jgi:hypothetical protein